MNLACTLSIYAGGPGSGCNPAVGHCGKIGGGLYYHGSGVRRAQEILREGLDPQKAVSEAGRVFVTRDHEYAKGYGVPRNSYGEATRSNAVVHLNIPEDFAGVNLASDDPEMEAYSKVKIPPEFVKKVEFFDKHGNLTRTVNR